MSTNFYVVRDCACCGNRQELLHIGKSSGSLRAHTASLPWPKDENVPEIRSWAQWKQVLGAMLLAGAEIIDEYDMRYTLDAFVARIEATSLDSRRSQYDWVMAHDRVIVDQVWLDAEGYSFYDGEFS